MRFQFPRLTPTVKKLLILLGASFVLTAVLENVAGLPISQWLALNLGFMSQAELLSQTGAETWVGYIGLAWQPFTYWIVWPARPESFLNAVLAIFFVYLFLAPFEESYGPKRVLQLCAAGILGGALGSVLVAVVLPSPIPIYGPGVIIDAVIGAFPVLFRDRKLYLIPFPFAIRPWAFAGVALALAALMAVLSRDPFVFISSACALGGGFAFAKWMTRPRGARPNVGKPPRRAGGPDLRVLKGGADDDGPRWLN